MRRRRSPRGRSRSRRRRRRFRRRVCRASLQTLPVFIHLLSSFSSTGKTSPRMTMMKHHRLSFPVHVYTGEKEIFSFDSFYQNSSKTQKRLPRSRDRHVVAIDDFRRSSSVRSSTFSSSSSSCFCLRVKMNAQHRWFFFFFKFENFDDRKLNQNSLSQQKFASRKGENKINLTT